MQQNSLFRVPTPSLLRFNYVIAKFEVLLSSSKLIKYPQTSRQGVFSQKKKWSLPNVRGLIVDEQLTERDHGTYTTSGTAIIIALFL